MTIKNNLRAGISLIFLIALLSSGLAAYYVYRLSNDSKAILHDNYKSLVFAKNINQVLDSPGMPNKKQLKIIRYNVFGEEGDITEPGEKAFADSLYYDFKRLSKLPAQGANLEALKAKMQKSAYGGYSAP